MHGEGREKARRGSSPRRSTTCNPHDPHFTNDTKGGWPSRESEGRLAGAGYLGRVVDARKRKECSVGRKRVERLEEISLGCPACSAASKEIREEMEEVTMEGSQTAGQEANYLPPRPHTGRG
jgi:hypothetical protein